MTERTCDLLEFDAVKARAAALALSEEAAEYLRAETPLWDEAAAEELRSLAREVRCRLQQCAASGAQERRDTLPAVRPHLALLGAEGASLDAGGALALGLFLERGQALRDLLGKAADAPSLPATEKIPLRALLAETPRCEGAAKAIFALIDHEGALRDLPSLRELRVRIQRIEAALERAASRYVKDSEKRRMLQSLEPSQRDGRLVLAVKANFRGRVRGIVRDVSATGQTIFVEPEEIVERNNELVIEKARLDAEIRRLLRELTETLRPQREQLSLFHEKILFLETLRAKARYGEETRGIFARSGPFALREARHPLLGASCIPITLVMASSKKGETRAVIITGPNTGGKTAALKTAGLLALMHQSGYPIPAAEETTLPHFDAIFADIGDEQSLSQSLSTFSAHIRAIADIAGAATERSLVLLDELGAGTDPEEGSAIAMAVLDALTERGARLIVTTHHGLLKNYGYTRKGVENASMEFDLVSLRPTFRVIMGLPGESRALEAAERNGLQSEVLERARRYLGKERGNVAGLLSGLKRKRHALDAEERASAKERRALQEERAAADAREMSLRQRELALKQEGLAAMRDFLSESRKTLENLVRSLREGEVTREKTLQVKAFLKNIEEQINKDSRAVKQEKEALPKREGHLKAESSAAFAPGLEVLAGERGLRGTLIRRDKKAADDGGPAWLVEVGSVKVRFAESALSPAAPAPAAPRALIARPDLAPAAASAEINLLGMRAPEARAALERQVDAAVLAGLGHFAVVHGTGEGVLQKTVHEYLKQSPLVADYYFSSAEQGGFGRTEVVLGEGSRGGESALP
ncbi:MAG: Smr/MutS family protein [Treponema sp.]|jgi:DNA mismatch repair protein MutS2|nr:Smr/MutS family protein [Treponema sp.]